MVVKISGGCSQALLLGNSDAVQVGDSVYRRFGNPQSAEGHVFPRHRKQHQRFEQRPNPGSGAIQKTGTSGKHAGDQPVEAEQSSKRNDGGDRFREERDT